MNESLKTLQAKFDEYESNKDDNLDINWELLKDILCVLGTLIISVAEELPDRLKWLKTILVLLADILKSVCASLTDEDFETKIN